jgi:predicted Zn-dependent peptidase
MSLPAGRSAHIPPAIAAVPRRACRAWLLLAPLVAALVLLARQPVAPTADAASGTTATGMLVTLSATADDLEVMPEGGLVIRITLENRTGADAGAVEVRAPLPQRTVLVAAWQGSPGQNAPAVAGDTLRWGPLSVANGARTEAFTYRVAPAPGADGAVIFRGATLQPVVTWETPAREEARPPVLLLNGLWGDRGVRRTVLPTGLTIFTVERPESQTFAIRMAVRAGSRDEDAVTRGGSHWLEHAFFLGTPRRPGNEEIFNTILNVGGNINASTFFEWTDYYNTVPAEHAALSLDVLSDQILNSTFPRDRFDRERRVVAEEIRRDIDIPDFRADIEFYQLLFQVSPIQQDPLGTVQSVADIPIETILAYRAQRYVTGNTTIAAAGRLQHDEAVAQIAAAFAPLPVGPRAVRPPVPEPIQTEPRRREIGQGTRVATIRVGWPVAGDDNLDELAALAVLEDILGATGRRLLSSLPRTNAPPGSYTPFYDIYADTGAFYFDISTRADGAQDAVNGVLSVIEGVRAGAIITETDVQESIRALIGRRALTGETSLGLTLRSRAEASGELESYLEYVARLQPVTAEDVQRVARKYLDTRNFTLVVVRS